jgi:putative flippase GtrA
MHTARHDPRMGIWTFKAIAKVALMIPIALMASVALFCAWGVLCSLVLSALQAIGLLRLSDIPHRYVTFGQVVLTALVVAYVLRGVAKEIGSIFREKS